MEPEDRIQRMADEGLLDEKQAEMLRDSFAGQHGVEPVPHSGVARVRGCSWDQQRLWWLP